MRQMENVVTEVSGARFVWGPPGGCSGRTTRISRCPASPSLSGLVRGGVHALAPHDTLVNSLAAKHAALAHARDAMRRAHALTKYYVRDRQLPGERDTISPLLHLLHPDGDDASSRHRLCPRVSHRFCVQLIVMMFIHDQPI